MKVYVVFWQNGNVEGIYSNREAAEAHVATNPDWMGVEEEDVRDTYEPETV